MAKLPVCPRCGEPVTGNHQSKKYQNRTYHSHCYKDMCDEIYKNSQGNSPTPTSPSSQSTTTQQQELYDFICKLFGLEELTGKIVSQLKNIFSENNFTYSGVRKTLDYFYNIKDHKPDLDFGIGIVPYVYEEAKQFYIKKNKIEKSTPKTVSKTDGTTVRITIKPKTPKQLIDIDKL